jgi:hypothetical protein
MGLEDLSKSIRIDYDLGVKLANYLRIPKLLFNSNHSGEQHSVEHSLADIARFCELNDDLWSF